MSRATIMLWSSAALCALAAACSGSRPGGLFPTPEGNGPTVIWDTEARPLPEIPYPNDLGTRADPSSPTGRRLNISPDAPTSMERSIRRLVNGLEGFSTFGPISVSFDRPLDLSEIVERHQQDDDPVDDVVLLINIDRESPDFGKLAPLDVGHGNFPLTMPELDKFGPRDPRVAVQNLLLDTTDEDSNGNGELDPGEDTDSDGHLDRPNIHPPPPEGNQLDHLASFYEMVTNTLIVRPLVPLSQQTRYAVVLTKNLVGKRGAPVRSPWAFVNHARQTAALEPLREVLSDHGFTISEVAFAWSFTTGTPTRDLEVLRQGLYGHGPLARLAQEFPADIEIKQSLDKGENLHIVPVAVIKKLIDTFGPMLDLGFIELTEEGTGAVSTAINNIDYFVMGEVEGPNLLADRDGTATEQYPDDTDEVWELDRKSGGAFYRPHKIPFICTIPRPDRGKGAPFPVAIYMHGLGSTRLEQIAFSGTIARYGIASCTIDSYGHGLDVGDLDTLARTAFKGFNLGPFYEAVVPGRARDLDNDGMADVGEDFFSADLFHSRDMIRQTVLDALVLVRALRRFDGERQSAQDLDGDGTPDIAGDFNVDGTVDIGGPTNSYFTWGTSLGAMTSAILAGIEPAIVAAAPQAGGGGVIDISARSIQAGVRAAALMRTMGPVIFGKPSADQPGKIDIFTLVVTGNDDREIQIYSGATIGPGDRIEVENLRNGERYVTVAAADGGFRAHVACDALSADEKRTTFGLDPSAGDFEPVELSDTTAAGDRLEIRVYDRDELAASTAAADGGGAAAATDAGVADAGTAPAPAPAQEIEPKTTIDTFNMEVVFEGLVYPEGQPLVALSWGLGRQRNTPGMRQLLNLAQLIVDSADPINYAPLIFKQPLIADYDEQVTAGANILVIVTAGDTTVPTATGISLARAAGIVDFTEVDPRYDKTPNQVLIDSYAVEGLSRLKRFGSEVVMDVDDLSGGKHAPQVPRLDPPLRLDVRTDRGLSGLRIPLLDPKGQHAFLIPRPTAAFDTDTFMVHMVARYFSTLGQELSDDPCMATESCDWIPKNAAPPEAPASP